MKKTLLTGSILVFLLLIISCATVRTPGRLYEKEAGFSYDPPAGWEITDYPGMKYKVCMAAPENGFAPNMNVLDEICEDSLNDYVDLSLRNMDLIFQDLKIIKRDEYKTEDGLEMVRIIYEYNFQGVLFRLTAFFIAGPEDIKYVITCASLADDGEKYDEVFLSSARSFRIH